jgi:hypothetical protein
MMVMSPGTRAETVAGASPVMAPIMVTKIAVRRKASNEVVVLRIVLPSVDCCRRSYLAWICFTIELRDLRASLSKRPLSA